MKTNVLSLTLSGVILTFLLPVFLIAQDFNIVNGTVYDSANLAIPEVNVIVKGSTRGVSTDANGKFTIKAKPTDNLVFSVIGYQDQELTVGNRTVINVVMSGSATILQNVVVNVGYGTQKRVDVTGAVSTISSKQIAELPLTNFQQALQGRVPGIDVVANGTSPGSGVTVRIRGRRSFSAGNDPLYVLDGIPMTGDMTDINPNDIESMDVLKDASATAIYGSRGANGVVLITTKKGRVGKAVIAYSGYGGITTPLGKYNVMGGKDYEKYRIEAFKTIGQTPNWSPVELESIAMGRSTNWQDLLLQNGSKQQHDLNVSGGSENTRYSISGSYFNEEGVISLQDFTRYNLKVSLTQNIGEKMRIGVASFASISKRNGQNFTPLSSALNLSPLTVPYDKDGKLIFFPNPNETIQKNPLSDLVPGALVDATRQSRIFASLYAEYDLTNDLSARVNFGPSFSTTRNGTFSASLTTLRAEGLPAATATNGSEFAYTLENILNYKKKINDHSFGATGLFSVQSNELERYSTSVEGVTADAQQFYNMGSASTIISVGSDYSKWAILSYMGRLNYSYKDRYLLTATGRADGSSRFAPGNQWGYFPSMAIGWRISEENFMKGVNFLNELKLRGGYGRTGNTGINPYATQGRLARNAYAFGESSAFGFHPSVFRNLELKWESTASFNVGLDFSLFNHRVDGNVDFYNQNTTDLLMDRQIPANTGFTSILSNIGATQNQGLEISVSTLNYNSPGGLKWTTDFTFYTNRERIVSLSTGKKDDPQNSWFIGKPLTVYYDYEKIGVWQTNEKAAAAGYGSVPGEIKLKDQDNNGAINSLDKVVLGSDIPKWTGGMTNRLSYKGFDFSIFLYTRQGSMIQSNYHESLATYSGKSNVLNIDYWTPENPTNLYPRANKNQEKPTNGSTLSYFSGSFVKIRNMQLGYNFSNALLGRLNMQSLRIYASAQQPFILFSPYVSKYYGIDPEFDRTMGINTPPTKIFMVGINARF